MKNKFPEKWYIKDCEEVANYAADKWGCKRYVGNLYYYEHSFNGRNYTFTEKSEIPKEYKEITLEEFKKYVLKENIMEKKIIGYKSPIDLFGGNIKTGTIFKPTSSKSTSIPKYCPVYEDNKPIQGFSYDLPKEIVEQWEPVYEEIPEYKVGDWVVPLVESGSTDSGSHMRTVGKAYLVYEIYNPPRKGVRTYNAEGKEDGNGSLLVEHVRPATKEEIETFLIEEAKKRYPIGSKFKSAYDNSYVGIIETQNFYVRNDNYITLNSSTGVCVYYNNKWAEILPSYPNITINGYRAEFFKNYVKFGCAEIDKSIFINLYNLIYTGNFNKNSNKLIESVTIGKGIFTKEQIKEIAEYYLNK